jgi:TorA specific chaperone
MHMGDVAELIDRVALYDGFAALFSEPLAASTIVMCREQACFLPLDALHHTPWAQQPMEQVMRVIIGGDDADAIASLLNRDFGALFLGIHGPHRVVASCRSDYPPNDTAAAVATDALLLDHGLAVAEGFVEPADHVAIELAAMAWLLDRDAIEALEFLDTHLLNWLPAFAAQCTAADTTGCYAAIATMLLRFLRTERDRLIAISRPALVRSFIAIEER